MIMNEQEQNQPSPAEQINWREGEGGEILPPLPEEPEASKQQPYINRPELDHVHPEFAPKPTKPMTTEDKIRETHSRLAEKQLENEQAERDKQRRREEKLLRYIEKDRNPEDNPLNRPKPPEKDE